MSTFIFFSRTQSGADPCRPCTCYHSFGNFICVPSLLCLECFDSFILLGAYSFFHLCFLKVSGLLIGGIKWRHPFPVYVFKGSLTLNMLFDCESLYLFSSPAEEALLVILSKAQIYEYNKMSTGNKIKVIKALAEQKYI